MPSQQTIVLLHEQQPGRRAPGQDMLLFELLRCTSRLKQVALQCINGILTGVHRLLGHGLEA